MNVGPLLITYAGLAALALAMTRHHRATFGRDASPRARLAWRAGGWALLALSLAASLRLHGAVIGAVAWLGEIAAAGLGLTLLLSFTPRWWAAPIPALFLLLVAG